MKYAEIKAGVCVNIVEADEDFARFMNLVEFPDGFGIGDYYENGTWSHDIPEHEPTQTVEERVAALESAIERGLNL